MSNAVEALRGARPRSEAVTMKLYSAQSDWLRGEAERSSPVVGLRVKRSALGPEGPEGKQGSWRTHKNCL